MKKLIEKLSLNQFQKEIIITIGRFFVGIVFFYSGFSKLISPHEYFEIAINLYQIIPYSWSGPISIIMPWIEITSGTFLLCGYMLPITTWTLAILTGGFQLILAQAILRRLPIDECGCFGGGLVHLTLYKSFVVDTIMFLILIQCYYSENRFSLDKLLTHRTSKHNPKLNG